MNEILDNDEKLEEKLKENLEESDNPSAEEEKKVKVTKKDKNKEYISKLENEIANLNDQYLRAMADMENTKRRLTEENVKNRMYAAQNLVTDLLNPIDMLLKVVNMETQSKEINNFLIGFKMISNQLLEVLANDGLKEIDVLGKEYDPQLAQSVEKVTIADLDSNVVTEVVQKGYMYKDRVIRPAMVKVNE